MLAALNQAHKETGKILQVTQHWVNYVMGDPLPIRAFYNIKCEQGDFEEWLALSIRDDGQKALLASYRIFPGNAPPAEMEQMIQKLEKPQIK